MSTALLDSRADVLERAVMMASTEGLEGLTIARLAGEVETDEFALADEFSSEVELQLSVWHTAVTMMGTHAIVPAMQEPPGRARLESLMAHTLACLEGDLFPGGCMMATVSHEFDNRPGPVRDAIHGSIRLWLDIIVAEARNAGAADPDRVAFVLHSLTQGVNQAYQLFGDEVTFSRGREEIAEAIDRLLPKPC